MKKFKSKINVNSPILFTCEHASSDIPKKYKNLGLTTKQLRNCKDLYDPNAFELFDALVKKFNSSSQYSQMSRLVVDMNRNLGIMNRDKKYLPSWYCEKTNSS